MQTSNQPKSNLQKLSELSQKELAVKMARHDIRTWQLHDSKEPVKLINEMAQLYALLYRINYEDAQEIMEPHVTAAWWHDIAETAEDAGDQTTADKCWKKAEENLRQHYVLLVEKMNKSHIQNLVQRVTEHDFKRWQTHHRRDIEAFTHHDASIRVLLLDINYDDSLIASKYVAEAVWLHNETDIRTNRGIFETDTYWLQAEKKMVEHYEYVLEIIQKLTDGCRSRLLSF